MAPVITIIMLIVLVAIVVAVPLLADAMHDAETLIHEARRRLDVHRFEHQARLDAERLRREIDDGLR